MLTRADLAKYPFLSEASEYIRELGLSIDDIATPAFEPVLERAEKRLEEALSKGKVSYREADDNAEILSFPVSNLILSVTGEERARRRFALAEAKRAYELLRQEPPDKVERIATQNFNWKLKRVDIVLDEGSTFPQLRKVYDFAVGITDFLRNAMLLKEPKWKLSNRVLSHGFVYATRDEVSRLLQEEVRTRIVQRTAEPPRQIPKLLQPKVDHTKGLIVKWLGVPTIYELMDQYKTPEAGKRLARVVLIAATLGRPIVAPPGLPADRVKLLRQAYVSTLKDPELVAEVNKRRWELNPISGEELEQIAKEVIVQPPTVIERMKWVLGRE